MKIIKKNIIVFLIVLILSFIFLTILNNKAMPIIINYAEVQTKRIGMQILKDSGASNIKDLLNKDDIFIITKNNNNEIETIDFNTSIINEALVIIATNVRRKLNDIEKGKNLPEEIKHKGNSIFYEVPLGIASGNVFLSNLGPKIPVRIKYSGNVGLDVKTRVKEYGINSALVEVYVKIEVTQRNIYPFTSKDIVLISEVPIIMKIIKGNTPNYLSGIDNSYSLPIE